MDSRDLAVLALVFTIIVPIVGLVIGIVALSRIKPGGEGRGIAIASIVVGSVLVLAGLVVLAMLFAGLIAGLIAFSTIVSQNVSLVDATNATL